MQQTLEQEAPKTATPIAFQEFPKLHRISRECIISEKIDGTNACIYIGESGEFLIGSRTRWITPEQDNHGFAKWAMANREELMKLGPGRHFGEWWGSGIQRNYGLKNEKRFSLFNSYRWVEHGQEPKPLPQGPNPQTPPKMQEVAPACCRVVPVLFRGIFHSSEVDVCLEQLKIQGSKAAPGFMNPEGIVVYHLAANVGFKKTLNNDALPKSALK